MNLPPCLRHLDPETIAAGYLGKDGDIWVVELMADGRSRMHRIRAGEASRELMVLAAAAGQFNDAMVEALRKLWPPGLRLVP